MNLRLQTPARVDTGSDNDSDNETTSFNEIAMQPSGPQYAGSLATTANTVHRAGFPHAGATISRRYRWEGTQGELRRRKPSSVTDPADPFAHESIKEIWNDERFHPKQSRYFDIHTPVLDLPGVGSSILLTTDNQMQKFVNESYYWRKCVRRVKVRISLAEVSAAIKYAIMEQQIDGDWSFLYHLKRLNYIRYFPNLEDVEIEILGPTEGLACEEAIQLGLRYLIEGITQTQDNLVKLDISFTGKLQAVKYRLMRLFDFASEAFSMSLICCIREGDQWCLNDDPHVELLDVLHFTVIGKLDPGSYSKQVWKDSNGKFTASFFAPRYFNLGSPPSETRPRKRLTAEELTREINRRLLWIHEYKTGSLNQTQEISETAIVLIGGNGE